MYDLDANPTVPAGIRTVSVRVATIGLALTVTSLMGIGGSIHAMSVGPKPIMASTVMTNPEKYVVERDSVDSRWMYVIATPRQLRPVNTLYVSHDGGRTWAPLRTPLGSGIQQVHFIDHSTGMIYGAPAGDPGQTRTTRPPSAYRTVDGGKHWRRVRLPDSLIAASQTYGSPEVRFLNTPGRLAWMFCLWNNQFPKYALYHSNDNGVRWTNANVSIGPESDLTVPAMGAIDPRQAYLVTFCEKCSAGRRMTGTYTLERTTDGGRTWQSVLLPFQGTTEVTSLRFSDNTHGIATVTQATTGVSIRYVTRDGGHTWTAVPQNPLNSYESTR
ncbi:MAG: hypothetical protein K6T83_02820 [Alicyclobacillus sp.]|nr:hypothetical protein [Alicyclobacillus sp.]